MKPNRPTNSKAESKAQKSLFQAVAMIESSEEARDFLNDLCTPAELQALTDRWIVVEPLINGDSYRDIALFQDSAENLAAKSSRTKHDLLRLSVFKLKRNSLLYARPPSNSHSKVWKTDRSFTGYAIALWFEIHTRS